MTEDQILEVAVKYSAAAKETTADELKQLMINDGIGSEDADVIIAELYPENKKNVPPTIANSPGIMSGLATPTPQKPTSPNAEFNLSGFDYKNLTGESFKKYVELVGDRSYRVIDKETGEEKPIVGKLKENEMYDFNLFKVEVVRKPRYAGVKDTPYDFNGVKVKDDKPVHTTRISVKHAIELNAQILNAHSLAGHGRYYLLKK